MSFTFGKPQSVTVTQGNMTAATRQQQAAGVAPAGVTPAGGHLGGGQLGGGQPGAAAANMIVDGSTATFARDVIEGSRSIPVVVDFWAPWCEPCKTLTPLLEKLVKSYRGKVKLVKINIDQNKQLAAQLRIQSVPTVYAFQDGQPIDAFMGNVPESQLKQFFDRLVAGAGPDPDLTAALEAAKAALAAGKLQDAFEIFAAVLQQDPANLDGIAGLAQCYIASGDLPRAEEMLAMVPADKRTNSAIAAVVAAIDLAKRSAASTGNTAELEGRIAADPKDHQARIDLAVALAASGRKEDAVTQLLDSIRRDRKWNEEAARKQLVQFFDAWGPKDAATLDGRRRLSSVLFS